MSVVSSSGSAANAVSSCSSTAERFSMAMASMPGFRFHPTDEELVLYYLKRKMCGKPLKIEVIRETDIYQWEPEDLPGLSLLQTGDRVWFFFSRKDRNYGARSNRGTRHGYWKATGRDRNVTSNSRTVGVKKTLVFHRGRAADSERTDWVMHEYTLAEEELKRCQGLKDYLAIYKVYKKSGPGPKNGEQYGAPFREEEWPDEVEGLVGGLMDDEPALPEFFAQETQSALPDPFSREVTFLEQTTMFRSCDQQHDVRPIFDFTRAATSPSHMFEAHELTSTPNIQIEELQFREDDFLELNDLIVPEPGVPDIEPPVENQQSEDGISEVDPPAFPNVRQPAENMHFEDGISEVDPPALLNVEQPVEDMQIGDGSSELDLPAFSNIEQPLENRQFEDGLSLLDLYHDLEMFLREMGPIDEGTVLHPSMIAPHSDITSQSYQLLPDQEDGNQAGGEFWMHDQRSIPSTAEDGGSFSPPTSGVICESTSFPTEGNENVSSTGGGVAKSRFSSALWDFVESIPATPASASENALVNQQMSGFNRVRINIKQANVSVGSDTATMYRAAGKGFLFLFFPILVALFSFLWVSVGTLRLLGRCINS